MKKIIEAVALGAIALADIKEAIEAYVEDLIKIGGSIRLRYVQ